MRGELGTSRRYVEQQYSDDANLATRQSIYAFQQPRLDLWNGSLDLAGLRGDEAVLDVGCGNGRYLEALHSRGHRGVVVGADLSAGMLQTARAAAGDGPLLVTDAQTMPFADASFDAALAMHMLYHVPDRAAALAEMRRVVRPGGVALALTNSEAHFLELDELLIASAAATVGGSKVRSRTSLTLFAAEHALPELEAAFADVTAHSFASELVVDEVEPVVAYARSMGAFVTDERGELEPVLEELARRVTAIIERDAAFRITTACAVFVCR
jgi:ubiquinone/menaquinone biosynthesis C-methylase UbiE